MPRHNLTHDWHSLDKTLTFLTKILQRIVMEEKEGSGRLPTPTNYTLGKSLILFINACTCASLSNLITAS